MDFLVKVEQEVADVECGTPSLGKRRKSTEMVMVHLTSNFVQCIVLPGCLNSC